MACKMNVEEDIDNLSLVDLLKEKENEIERLRKQNEENKNSLVKAGEYGQSLMQTNSSLEEMIENVQIEHGKVIEEYEQKTYSLENKLEVLTKMKAQVESNMQEESQRWKKEIEHVRQQAGKKLTDINGQLKSKLEDVANQLQQEKLISTQRLETLELKEGQIQKLNKEVENLHTSLNDTMSTEVAELTNENSELKYQLQKSENVEHELAQRVQQLKDALEISTNNEKSLRQAKEDANRETCDYYNMLEESREDCRELQAELDMIKLQSRDPNSCGNSLFGEVEDKRVQAEKRFISMKSKYKSMQGQMEQWKHYILKLKMQISALLETRSSSADQEHVRALEEAVSISRSDNNKLLHKLKLLQDKLTNERSTVKNLHSDDQAIDSALVQVLKNELKVRNREVDRLTEELRLSEICQIAEMRNVTETRRELYEKRKQLDVTKAHNFKQQIEIDRLKMKCGEDIQVRTYRHKYKTEKLFQKSSQNNTGTETHGEDNTMKGEENEPGVDEKQYPLKENVPVIQKTEMQPDNSVKNDEKNHSGVTVNPLSERQSLCDTDSKLITNVDLKNEMKSEGIKSNCNIQTVDRSRIRTVDDCKQQ